MLKNKNLIYYVLILAFFIRLYGILLLNLGYWDEQFHALVSKNLMKAPFEPSLITDGLVSLDIKDWSLCDIWLSKPPMAFWSMALSMKIFGINEFGLRFPSLIFSLLTIYLAYIIARKLYSERIGVATAFFYSINGILYEINVGLLSGDHVDTLFHLLFHVSIFLILYFIEKPSLLLGSILGFVIGIAFLTKWIMSFFIFFICILYFIYVKRELFQIVIFICSASLAFFITVSPWLYWIFNNFPDETRLIFEGVLFPISNVVQGHSGMWYYYLNSIRININELVYIPILFFIYQTLKKPSNQNVLILFWIIVPLLLLSLSTTKREVYILISATPLFIIISLFINFIEIYKYKYSKSVYFIQMLFFILAIRYSVERIKPWKPRLQKAEFRNEMEALINVAGVPSDSMVIINDPNFIKGRFYYGVLGYRYLNDSTINNIRSKGYKVFNTINGKYKPIE